MRNIFKTLLSFFFLIYIIFDYFLAIPRYRPYLLLCGHNTCENCLIQNKLRGKCSICQESIKSGFTLEIVARSKNHNILDLNYYLVGLLHQLNSYNKNHLLNDNSCKAIDLPKTITILPLLETNSDEINYVSSSIAYCSKCLAFRAELKCVDCNKLFCECCYNQTHEDLSSLVRQKIIAIRDGTSNQNSKLINHKTIKLNKSNKMMLENPYQTLSPTNSVILPDQHQCLEDEYCKLCRKRHCVVCKADKHKGYKCVNQFKEKIIAVGDIIL